ncbi:MAG: PIN domain-containing protein [Candidatus Peribacteria bacterium]|jgi:predicted nucleic acid-binding protein|nr:PIN domain-containing protein [Candidatus Peribacteria bacterium]
MKYIFDTSFLVALYFLDDSNHEKAIERFSLFSDEDIFYINELTYTELLTVFTYKK